RYISWRVYLAPLLYLGVLVFNLGVTFWLGGHSEGEERQEFLLMGIVGTFIFIPVLVLLIAGLFDPSRRATAHDIEEHIQDFPDSSLGH
ncbi:MAG: hypothetical protein O6952_03915, partial [Planctomycetota bacterium]|nr:hypothetical protein [Planctomycetota bacterium]